MADGRGIRVVINKRENWCLNPKERVLLRKMIDVIKLSGRNGVTLLGLYEQTCNRHYTKIQPYLMYRIKYLLMLLWKLGEVRIRYNNAFCLIHWKKLKTGL